MKKIEMLPDKKFDCIVVGGGPGGSSFAFEAASNGLKVLVLDKRQSIGEPVRCGEGVAIGTFKDNGIAEDPRYCINWVDGYKLFSPGGNSVTNPKDGGYVVDRFLFDKVLALRAADAGATFVANAEATNVSRVKDGISVSVNLFGERSEVTAPLVVGADGRESRIAKMLGIRTELPVSSIDKCFQYDMVFKVDEPQFLKIYLGREMAPKGYAWIFPKGPTRANVGIGVSSLAPLTAKEYLDRFIASHGIRGSPLQHVSGTIPLDPPKHDVYADNFMLVGDAGRFVNPIHGGGIGDAMYSAKLAAQTAVAAFKKGDLSSNSLKGYAENFDEKMKSLRFLAKVKTVLTSMSDDDLDYIIKKVDGPFVQAAANGKSQANVLKLLLGRPSLLRFAAMLR